MSNNKRQNSQEFKEDPFLAQKKLCTETQKFSEDSSSSDSPIQYSTNEDLDTLYPIEKKSKNKQHFLISEAIFLLENFWKYDLQQIRISHHPLAFHNGIFTVLRLTQQTSESTQNYELIFIKNDSPQSNFYLENFQKLVENLQKDSQSSPLIQYVPLKSADSQKSLFFASILAGENNQKNTEYQVLLKQIPHNIIQQEPNHQELGSQLALIQQKTDSLFLPGLNLPFSEQLAQRSQTIQQKIPKNPKKYPHHSSEEQESELTKEQIYEKKHDNEILIPQIADYYNLQYETYILPRLNELPQGLVYNRISSEEQITLEKVGFGFKIENLVNQILKIYIQNSENIKDSQPKINAFIKGFNSVQKIEEFTIEFVFYLLASRIITEITLNLEFSNECRTILKQLIKINPVFFENELRLACDLTPLYDNTKEPNYDEFINQRKKSLLRNMLIFFQKTHPVKIVKSAFQYLYDDHGRTFIDCANNVQHVGHSHPKVVRAGSQQMTYFNSNTRFLNNNIVNYAENLQKTAFPPELNVCMFCNSGSEANDMALYISRLLNDSQDIIIMDHSYHGTTTAVVEISETKYNGTGGIGRKDYIHVTDMPDEYRGKFSYEDENSGEKYAQQVKDIIDNLKKKGRKPAAFICESMPAVGGMTTLPKGYLKKVYEYVREAGGICIADEVQVGFGRVENKWWAYELQDVIPDIVVIGKPMGNGHPVAGLVMTEEIANKFNNGQKYFNTYGGNPVSMKIANEVLNTIVDEKMRENADMVGQYLFSELKKLSQKHEIIGDVRGSGLFIGIEIVKDKKSKTPGEEEAESISNQLKNKGFIMLHEGHNHNVLKIKPALTFSLENSRDLVKCLDNIVQNKLY